MSAVMTPFDAPVDIPPGRWKTPALLAGCALLVVLAIAGLRHIVADSKPPARQVARIAILPDTPPPPPPPKVEKKDEPKPDTKPAPQTQEPPKPVAPPAPEPIKMEGAAGDGPSAFAAGKVNNEYQGGTPVVGTPGGSGLDRAQERLYANTVRQQLHDEIERQLGADAGELSTQLAVWIAADGRIERWELQGPKGTHDAEIDAALRRSAEALRLPSPPPETRQPLRFRLSLHSAG